MSPFKSIEFTPEGGLGVRMINKTGSASVRGTVVKCGSANNGFIVASANEDLAVGVVYDDGIADGSPCRVIVSGLAYVLLKDGVSATVGYIAYCSDTAGRIITAATIPSAEFHWREIGHCHETVSSGTDVLALCVLHFN